MRHVPPQTLDDLRQLITAPESSQVEFKEAINRYSKSEALRYLCAFANEGGGSLVFGVSDRVPREIVGSQAFPDIDAQVHNWSQTLRRRIRPVQFGGGQELFEPGPRVLVLSVEGRDPGEWVTYNQTPWVREGESLIPMSASRMREISREVVDVSAQFVIGSTLDDIDPEALDAFRNGLSAKAQSDAARRHYQSRDVVLLLRDLGLVGTDGTLTKAALLLLGREAALQT